ncbi:hypothetical protein ACX1C1_23145 [Paenibacillus sp. strain BS8-2]
MRNTHRLDKHWRLSRWMGATMLVLLLAGCQNVAPAGNGNDNHVASITEQITSNGPQKSYLEQSAQQENNSNTPGGNTATIDNDTSAEASSLEQANKGKTSDNDKLSDQTWNASNPSLRGITIGEKEANVTLLLGSELDSYVLEEENSKIRVMEYDGLSIGFNTKGNVHYVEVFGAEALSGLNGLMIGDEPDQAIKMLGKPQSQSDYLLTYQAQGAWLKLDIDPGMNEIVSMKLIAST